jgi:hypothetical protein
VCLLESSHPTSHPSNITPRSVIESFSLQRTAVLLATPRLAAALINGAAAGGPGITLHIKVGVPAGALARAAALASGAGTASGAQQPVPLASALAAAAWDGSSSSSSGSSDAATAPSAVASSRLMLLLDYEAEALLARVPRQQGKGAAAAPQSKAATGEPLQQRLDGLAAGLVATGARGTGSGTFAAPGPPQPPPAAAAVRVRELTSLQPALEAALRRVPPGLKARAYVAWLSRHMGAARQLGWSRQAVGAQSAVYARSVGELGRGVGGREFSLWRIDERLGTPAVHHAQASWTACTHMHMQHTATHKRRLRGAARRPLGVGGPHGRPGLVRRAGGAAQRRRRDGRRLVARRVSLLSTAACASQPARSHPMWGGGRKAAVALRIVVRPPLALIQRVKTAKQRAPALFFEAS